VELQLTLGLWILRHAKAASAGPGGDSTRPLTGKGRRQADAVKEHIDELGPDFELPALVLCSPAARALETAKLVSSAMPKALLDVEPELYDEDASGLVDWLRTIRPDEQTLMIVGHNPTLLDLCLLLSDPLGSKALDTAGLPTAGLVVLSQSGATGWSQLAQGSSRIEHRFVPEV
jgi:phosphohistidine phosphatase